MVRFILKDGDHPRPSHIGVYVYGSGAFGDKPKLKDKRYDNRRAKKSRDLAVQSIP